MVPSSLVKETKFYDLLGVKPGALDSELKEAYQKLADSPEMAFSGLGASEKFKKVTEAYEILSDEHTRQIYNLEGEEGIKYMGVGDTRCVVCGWGLVRVPDVDKEAQSGTWLMSSLHKISCLFTSRKSVSCLYKITAL